MKTIIVATFLLTSSFVFGQFKKADTPAETTIGKAKAGGFKIAELSYYVVGNDTTYHLFYKDKKFTTRDEWKQVFFKGGSEALDGLSNTLLGLVDSAKGNTSSFELGDNSLMVKVQSMVGTKYLTMAFTDKVGIVGLSDLTRKQIRNLFNKSDED